MFSPYLLFQMLQSIIHGRVIRNAGITAAHKVVVATECLELHPGGGSKRSSRLGHIIILERRINALKGIRSR